MKKPFRSHFYRFLPLTAALLLIAALFADTARILSERKRIRTDFLRLHVIAASDSEEDQRLKLAVRDAVLSAGAALFNGSVTADQAEKRIQPRVCALEYAAEKTLRENGCFDDVRVEVKREYFPERQYGELALPPGVYQAVKVTIGKGEGHNWWCVMFPPLCLPETEADAESLLSEADRALLRRSAKYDIRFKTAELCEKLISGLRKAFAGE